MKILRVIYSTHPASGGPVEGLKQFAAGAESAGHRTEVMSLDPVDAPHLQSFPLPVHAMGPVMGKYGYSPRAVPWLKANAGKFDAIVVDGVWQYHSLAVWRALRNLSMPYFVFTHGMLDPWFQRQYPIKHIKKLLYWFPFERRVLRDAAAVLYTCEEERVLASHAFPLHRANERIVYPGTSPPAQSEQLSTEAFLSRRPELGGKRLVLFLGRMHPKKGCDLLLHAFAEAFRHDPEWHLVMSGPDQLGWQSELEQIASRCGISQRVTWTGMLTESEKWASYRAAEVFVLPSHQENFGLVVAEALACGLPVLLSDKVNIWREVVDAGAGLVASDDVAGTVASFNRWKALLPAAQEGMRKAALECFRSKFASRAASQKFIEVLASFTGTRTTEVVHV